MKKLALALLLAVPLLASAADPRATVQLYAMNSLPPRQVEFMLFTVTTTTTANASRTAIMTSSTGTESAPTGAVGLDLTGIGAVQVFMATSSNASTGTLQAYIRNAETGNWNRVPALDLTAIASTAQGWAAINVPVSRGRIAWVPNGIGSVSPVVYIVGQVR